MSSTVSRYGVVGTGRLGKVLIKSLARTYHVACCDRDVRRAKQFAKQSGTTFLYPDELVRTSDVVLLCIPGSDVAGWLRDRDESSRAGTVYVNMATDLPTSVLVDDESLLRLRIVGLKPIAQFAAMDRGLPGLFVTQTEDASDLDILDSIVAGLGWVTRGNESDVGELNRIVTEAALKLCLEVAGYAESRDLQPQYLRSALSNVAVGTILDYPPDTSNTYTREILARLRQGGVSALSATACEGVT